MKSIEHSQLADSHLDTRDTFAVAREFCARYKQCDASPTIFLEKDHIIFYTIKKKYTWIRKFKKKFFLIALEFFNNLQSWFLTHMPLYNWQKRFIICVIKNWKWYLHLLYDEAFSRALQYRLRKYSSSSSYANCVCQWSLSCKGYLPRNKYRSHNVIANKCRKLEVAIRR